MLERIKTHVCGACGKDNMIVTTYTIIDGQYFQLCKECQRTALGKLIARMSEDDVKNLILLLTDVADS